MSGVGGVVFGEGKLPDLNNSVLKAVNEMATVATESSYWDQTGRSLDGLDILVGTALWRTGKWLDKSLTYYSKTVNEPIKWGKVSPTPVHLPFGVRVDLNPRVLNTSKTIFKTSGKVIGYTGVAMSTMEIFTGKEELFGEGGLDVVMGIVGFWGPVGFVVSTAYFGTKLILEVTGNDWYDQ